MNKRTHRNKVKMARRMRTPDDIKRGVPIFMTENWVRRGLTIAQRVTRQQASAHAKAMERKGIEEDDDAYL